MGAFTHNEVRKRDEDAKATDQNRNAGIRGGETLPAGFTVGDFRLDSISRESRTVTVGCHTVTFDEIERLAQRNKL